MMRDCRACGADRAPGHDPCIAELPGVLSACCGHGRSEPYVQFPGPVVNECVYGEEAVEAMRALGGSPPTWSWWRRMRWLYWYGSNVFAWCYDRGLVRDA